MAPPPAPTTLFSADLPSEDEEDGDFSPPSPTSSTTSSNAPSSKKRRKLSHSPPPPADELKAPDAFSYADLVASAGTGGQAGKVEREGQEKKQEIKMVTIMVERKFAGEVVRVETSVPANSPEAVAFFAASPTTDPASAESSVSSRSAAPPPVSSSSTHSAVVPLPPPARAPPKKRRTSALESAAAAPKLKKMTTMEKSALDWQAASAQLVEAERDELERNRRKGGAGFLEKTDFLSRVAERTEGGPSTGGRGERRGGP